jgi:hypothetical protein
MFDWSIYVPPFNLRAILMVALVINGIILITLCFIEKHKSWYKGVSILLLFLTGILFWSEASPSPYRDMIKIIDQCCILLTVIIHIFYFKYNIQYMLILISTGLFILEVMYPSVWFLFHISIYICLMIAFLSTYYKIVYK